MRFSHGFTAVFDDPNLVSCAYLAPVLELAERAGFQDLIADHVRIGNAGGAKPALKIPALVAGIIAGTGADSIDDMALLLTRRRSSPSSSRTNGNQVWSWDITKLHVPAKWSYFYLYAILDVYSRKTVGWMVATRESATLAEQLLAPTITAENVPARQLTIHADRGSSIASTPVALLLADLGVTETHSRPRVSNDNPYIESHFKTLKYCPSFPGTFASLEDAREFCAEFFNAYNHHHRHAGLGLLTPEVVHSGQAKTVHAKRALWSWTRHMPYTATDSADPRSHPSSPAARGSTNPHRARPSLSNS